MNRPDDFRKYAVHHLGISGSKVDQYTKHITNTTPYIIEERPNNFRAIDVFTRLIADRIIFLGTPVDDTISNLISAQLLYLESQDSKSDILMYINSPGGSIHDGLAVYDTMNYVAPDIHTICTGLAASMSAVLLASGKKGKRGALKHSRIMIHQPSAGIYGTSSDLEIELNQVNELKKDLYEILSEKTGQTYAAIAKDSDRDYWMRSSEAKTYGLIDNVYETRSKR